MLPANSLQGLRILVTRASHQAEALCESIRQAGGQALHFPVLDIVPAFGHPSIDSVKQRLEDFDIAIFISANAVEFGLQTLGQLPQRWQLACVGQQTAAALSQHGYHPDIVPAEDFTSEGLLNLDELQQVNQRQILIVRGEGGRETLKQHLLARGAEVSYLECYRRQIPNLDYRPLQAQVKAGAIDVITVSSSQSLDSLSQVCPLAELRQLPLIAINQRMAERAQAAGYTHIAAIAANASDGAILEALLEYHQAQPAGKHP